MDENRDPRIQIYANLDNVQKEIDSAAKDRIKEIRNEADDDIKSLKKEAKDLKHEAKNQFEEYKKRMENSDDPDAKEKISMAKDASKMVERDIEDDYQQTRVDIENEVDMRINSIDDMQGKQDDND